MKYRGPGRNLQCPLQIWGEVGKGLPLKRGFLLDLSAPSMKDT